MEKDRSTKIIAVLALFVAVIGLSIGFSAFSRSLNIESEATVKPTNTFSVKFSSSADSLSTDDVVPTKTPNTLTATDAEIVNTGDTPTISGLSAEFTEPGQSVEYTFYVVSNEYDAFLRSITYNSAEGETSHKVCTAKDTATTNATSVANACNGISVKVEATDAENNVTSVTGTNSGITGHKLAKGAYQQVKVTIEYSSTAAKADGDFDVKFGSISLGYKTIDA